jgi:hypothetical protein
LADRSLMKELKDGSLISPRVRALIGRPPRRHPEIGRRLGRNGMGIEVPSAGLSGAQPVECKTEAALTQPLPSEWARGRRGRDRTGRDGIKSQEDKNCPHPASPARLSSPKSIRMGEGQDEDGTSGDRTRWDRLKWPHVSHVNI